MSDTDSIHAMLRDLAARTSGDRALAVCRITSAVQCARDITQGFSDHMPDCDCPEQLVDALNAIVTMHIEAEGRALGADPVQLAAEASALTSNIRMVLLDAPAGLS